MFCFLFIVGLYLLLFDKFLVEVDCLEEFVLFVLEGFVCVEFEFELEGFNIFFELFVVGLLRVDIVVKSLIKRSIILFLVMKFFKVK